MDLCCCGIAHSKLSYYRTVDTTDPTPPSLRRHVSCGNDQHMSGGGANIWHLWAHRRLGVCNEKLEFMYTAAFLLIDKNVLNMKLLILLGGSDRDIIKGC